MRYTQTSKFLCILSALCSLCVAQHNVSFTSDHFVDVGGLDDNSKGPWGMSLTEFKSHFTGLEHNASTYLRIDGPNVSYAYPGNPNWVDPWVLSVDVTADIPAANTSSDVSPADKSRFFTGSIVNFQVPTMISNISGNHSAIPPQYPEYTDWNLCLFTWNFSSVYNISYPDKLREDDGNCTSIVSEQCVRDMENAVVQNYNALQRQCQCPSVSKLSSCDQSSLFARLGCVARSKLLHIPSREL